MSKPTPFQDDGFWSLDRTVKDYDLLQRLHKQSDWNDDQERHFQAGWQACMEYYRECFKKVKP
jgi:hypothetical protein